MPKVTRDKWRNKYLEWFRDIIADAKVMDYRYPIKGFGVWQPYGFKIRKAVTDVIRRLHDETGHEEALFPLLVPEDQFQKEAKHVKGFENEVFWVTQGGLTPLDIKLVLRPTSETAIYPMYRLWIRSHTDLPVILYQIVNTFRYETKATKPMIRVREITTFKEAHTAHATSEDAENQVQLALSIYKKIFDELRVPYILCKRPDWDKFAGAVYTIALDTITPNGRSLQIGTVHNLGQNFSKTFDIKYEREDGSSALAYQTCYGISERAVAALISTHGDDNGLVLPPDLAPTQIVIVPILFKKTRETTLEYCRKIFHDLTKAGYKVKIDERDLTPGKKYYEWEQLGIPIRVEIGPKDIEKKQVVLFRRDTLERIPIATSTLKKSIKQLANDITKNLSDAAWQRLSDSIYVVDSLADAEKIIKARKGFCLMAWCGSTECGSEISERMNVNVLGVPIPGQAILEKKGTPSGECPVCSKESQKVIIIAKAY